MPQQQPPRLYFMFSVFCKRIASGKEISPTTALAFFDANMDPSRTNKIASMRRWIQQHYPSASFDTMLEALTTGECEGRMLWIDTDVRKQFPVTSMTIAVNHFFAANGLPTINQPSAEERELMSLRISWESYVVRELQRLKANVEIVRC